MSPFLKRAVMVVISTIAVLAIGQTMSCEVKSFRGDTAPACVDVETRTLAVLLSLLTTLLGLSTDAREP